MSAHFSPISGNTGVTGIVGISIITQITDITSQGYNMGYTYRVDMRGTRRDATMMVDPVPSGRDEDTIPLSEQRVSESVWKGRGL